MSNIEGITSTNPFGNNDTIAKVNITQNGYLPIATFPNSGQYILSAYIKADKSTEIRFLMNETSEIQRMSVSNAWKELEIPITANTNDELILRLPTNTYYLYNWKIEEGNKATTYTVAPEDTDEQIDELNVQYSEVIQTINSISATVGKHTTEISNKADNSTVTEVKNQVSQLTLDLDGFRTEVSDTYTTKTESQQIQSNIDSVSDNLASFSNSISKEIEDLQNQLDGSITTWFYDGEPTLNNEPAVNWTTTEEKNTHIGDIYYDTITGYSYRFQIMNNQYVWHLLADSDVTKALEMASKAQDTADSKRRVFVNTPYPPYEVGDLWVGNTSSELMRCKTERLTGNYSSSDWEKAVKYTDDTTANAVKNNLETNYSTTTQMNSAIEQTASSIKTEVSSTYATKTSVSSDIQSAVGGIEIGGRNLFIGSAKYNDWYSTSQTETDYIEVGSNREITVSLERRVASGAINTTYCTIYQYDLNKNAIGSINVLSGAVVPIYTRGFVTFTTDSNAAYIKLVFRPYTYFRHIKVEYGNKATDWTEAPEDVEENIESVRTVATQTADKFSWLVESGTSSSNFVLTDRTAELVAKIISLNGDVKVNGDMLVDGAVTAEKIDVEDLYSLKATIAKWDINEQSISSSNDTDGEFEDFYYKNQTFTVEKSSGTTNQEHTYEDVMSDTFTLEADGILRVDMDMPSWTNIELTPIMTIYDSNGEEKWKISQNGVSEKSFSKGTYTFTIDANSYITGYTEERECYVDLYLSKKIISPSSIQLFSIFNEAGDWILAKYNGEEVTRITKQGKLITKNAEIEGLIKTSRLEATGGIINLDASSNSNAENPKTAYIKITHSSKSNVQISSGSNASYIILNGIDGRAIISNSQIKLITSTNSDSIYLDTELGRVYCKEVQIGGSSEGKGNLIATGYIKATGSVTASSFVNSSSKRYKDHIDNMTEEEADKLLLLDVVKFDYKHGAKGQYGLYAEDVYEHIPTCVHKENDVIEGIDYTKIIPFMIKKIQMQEKQINELTEKVNKLSNQN